MFRVTRKDGTTVWRATRTTYISADGKQQRVAGEGPTQAVAIERREQAWQRYLVRRGELPLEALNRTPTELKVTVEDWLWRWHTGLGDEVGEQTKAQYASRIRLHLVPHIGTTPLRLLTSEQVETLIYTTLPAKRKVVSGKQTEQPLLGATAIRAVFFVLSQALDEAKRRRLVDVNPCEQVRTPRRSKRKDEGVHRLTWTAQHLLGKLEGHDDEARWWCAFLGMRQSEVLGLTDDCLRLTSKSRATLTVKQQLARHVSRHGCGLPIKGEFPCGQKSAADCPKRTGETGLYIKQDTKTEASRRVIPVVEPFYSVIRAHMNRQRALRASERFNPLPGVGMDRLVFTSRTGRPRRHQRDNEQWHALLDEFGVPNMRGHLARHVTVSLLISQGVAPDVVKQIVGHSDLVMTEYYTHTSSSQARAPLATLGEHLNARTKRSKADVAAEKARLLAQAEKLRAQLAALEVEQAE